MSMRFLNSIFTIDSHTAGHATRIVVDGLPKYNRDSVTVNRERKRKIFTEVGINELFF